MKKKKNFTIRVITIQSFKFNQVTQSLCIFTHKTVHIHTVLSKLRRFHVHSGSDIVNKHNSFFWTHSNYTLNFFLFLRCIWLLRCNLVSVLPTIDSRWLENPGKLFVSYAHYNTKLLAIELYLRCRQTVLPFDLRSVQQTQGVKSVWKSCFHLNIKQSLLHYFTVWKASVNDKSDTAL